MSNAYHMVLDIQRGPAFHLRTLLQSRMTTTGFSASKFWANRSRRGEFVDVKLCLSLRDALLTVLDSRLQISKASEPNVRLLEDLVFIFYGVADSPKHIDL